MKAWVLAAVAVLAVGGCKAKEETPAPAATSSSAMAPAANSMKPAGAASMAGNYALTMKDGTKRTSMLNADGSYMDMDASGKTVEKGKWEQRADGKACFTEEGKTETVCYAIGPTRPDGTFVATPDKGDPITVKKTS